MTDRVVVLGGGGFIGRAVIAALGGSGVAASRRPVPGRAHVLCDATDRASLAAACAGASAVVNAAAGSNAAMLRVTQNLCAVAGQGGQQIVHLSSMAVYGAATGLVREDAPLDSEGSSYAAGKIAGEAVLLEFRSSGGAASILRPGIVYGPGDQQWMGRLCRLLRAGRLGDLGAGGDGFCNLVHVRDVAAACLACLQAPGGTFNLAARTPPRWNEVFSSLALAIGAVPLRRIGHRRLAWERRVLAPPLEIAKRAAARCGWAPGRLPEPLPPSLLALFANQIRLDPTRADGLALSRSDDQAGLAESRRLVHRPGMIGDTAELEAGAVLAADICIAGSGAAGISLALALIDSGLSVLLLEGGGAGFEAASQALYQGKVADPLLHSPTDTYRRRSFGGSTAIWGGRCVPFDAIDFEARPWVAGSVWPFRRETLAPWYRQANALCEAGRFAYTAAEAFPAGLRPMLAGFAGEDFSADTLERFSIPTDFGARYRGRLAQSGNVRLLLHASVVGLRTGAGGRVVDRLDVAGAGGRRFTVRAGQVVLAVGGLETPRLLLASRDHHADGIGNLHGQVGRYYMCHLAGTLGVLRPAAPAWHGYDLSDDGVYCRQRLALTPSAQRRLRAGNFVARLHHPRIPDPSHRTGALSALYLAKPFISHEYGKRLHGGVRVSTAAWLSHMRNVAVDARGTGGFLLHWLRRRTLSARKFPSVIVSPKGHRYSLDFHAEQEPNPLSRVTVAHDRDALGLPRLVVDWRHTALDMHTIRVSLAALAAQMAASKAGSFVYDPEEVELAALQDGAYGGHHIGTTRMSPDARSGVVDADCRVHGMDNLFVAGSAVFPTSSQANPTLTIVALTLRLADHLTAVVHRQQASVPAEET